MLELLAAIVALFVFVTGVRNLPDLMVRVSGATKREGAPEVNPPDPAGVKPTHWLGIGSWTLKPKGAHPPAGDGYFHRYTTFDLHENGALVFLAVMGDGNVDEDGEEGRSSFQATGTWVKKAASDSVALRLDPEFNTPEELVVTVTRGKLRQLEDNRLGGLTATLNLIPACQWDLERHRRGISFERVGEWTSESTGVELWGDPLPAADNEPDFSQFHGVERGMSSADVEAALGPCSRRSAPVDFDGVTVVGEYFFPVSLSGESILDAARDYPGGNVDESCFMHVNYHDGQVCTAYEELHSFCGRPRPSREEAVELWKEKSAAEPWVEPSPWLLMSETAIRRELGEPDDFIDGRRGLYFYSMTYKRRFGVRSVSFGFAGTAVGYCCKVDVAF